MIGFSAIKNSDAAAEYYSSTEQAAEYYADQGRVPSRWLGTGAAMQHLRGEVGREALLKQLDGIIHDANGERRLGIQRAGEWQHRAGWDLTVSAPKSVSLEILVHDRKDVDAAHATAVQAVIAYLERNAAQARINGQYVKTGNLTAAAFDHVASRAGDPQKHTHLIISNVTIDENGIARSVSNEQLLQYRRAADAVYHNTLSHELQKLGYSVRHDREGRVEIADYKPEQLRDFSTRSKEIEAALAARGQTREGSSAEARQIAALATRADKNAPETRAAHAERWLAQAEALGIKPADRDPAIAREVRQAEGWTAAEIAGTAVQKAVAHLTSTEAVFREKDLHMQAARFSAGRCDWKEIEKALADLERRGEIIREPGATTVAERLTTRSMVEAERQMAERLEAGRGDHQAVLTAREFTRALAQFEASRGFRLSDEQRAAAAMILTGRDTFQGVQGAAGTGKTTLLAFVREAAESKGWRVIGHSNGAEQAATMQRESGIQTTTTASHLLQEQAAAQERGRASPDDVRELRIMDEASQAGQKAFNAVIESTAHAGARTVFLGDKLQHQSVEAGRAFERAQAHMPVATLGEGSIRRQRTSHMKEAVRDILAGKHGAAIRKLPAVEVRTAQAALPATATRDDRRAAARADNAAVIQRLAGDYAALRPEERARTLVLTSTNADRVALNSAIRAELQQHGELGRGVQVETLRKSTLSPEELKRAESFTPGQIVEVQADYRRAELARGSRWSVAEVSGNTLTLRDAEGRTRVVDPSAIKLQAYDRDTREIAAGDRLRWTENHRAQRQDHPLEDGLKVRNGASAIVEKVSADRITLRCADGEQIHLDPRVGQKVEHDYASTSYSAQGRTVDAVLIHHNTEAGAHGQRETYVDITRARDHAVLYTQDADKAGRQAGLEIDKSAAHDIAHDITVERAEHQPDHEHDHDQAGPEYEYGM
ncbi:MULTISPECIES: MobF family relaxase [Metallibacterium]|jgi:conjugative relaxase-like TrwC/TraI family protein|uniref:MobF family relaxase n=1 Tax=Metallibacterium TaxID=1218803 RepID=UPI0026336FF1|nr:MULTISPECIES: MobF family relaxase [Metallibacterium]MBW8075267.1 relaxase domain-containing protein [Metallibacterium scheffleri]